MKQRKKFRVIALSISFTLALSALIFFGNQAKASKEQHPTRSSVSQIKPVSQIKWARVAIQKGRETGEAIHFQRADRLLSQFAGKTPDEKGEMLGLKAWLALFRHEFKKAAKLAEEARTLQPGQSFHYGLLSDAALEQGRYEKAIEYTQKMLDLRSDQAALSRAAHLRSLHGDPEGAILLWQKAIRSGAPSAENTAWSQVELGDEYFNLGQLAAAKQAYKNALKTYPGYPRAWAGLGRLRAVEHEWMEAVENYKKAIAVIPMPRYVAALGRIYGEMGRKKAAEKQFALVAHLAQLDEINQIQYNRDLALFYADQNIKLDEAVRIAEKELRVRRDIHTYDILGWVYYKRGDYKIAEAAMTKALHLGTKNPLMLFHAGMVAQGRGKKEKAVDLLQQALAQNPKFHPRYAEEARQTLVKLNL